MRQSSTHRPTERGPRPASPSAGKPALNVPAYFLYGEDWTAESFGFFHIEPFSVRNVPNNWRIGIHLHPDFHQFSITLSGGCSFQHDGQIAKVDEPCCIFTPANVVHEFVYEPESAGYVVSVSPDFLASLSLGDDGVQSVLSRLSAQRSVHWRDSAQILRLQNLVSHIAEVFSSKHERGQDIIRYLFGAFICEMDSQMQAPLEQASPALRPSVATADLFSRFRECVTTELELASRTARPTATPHTVEFFSTQLMTSTYALNTACRRATGRSARDIIQAAVVGQAMRMLLYSNRSVKEIAYQLGYSHPTHFVRFIKRRQGMTPEMIRQNFLEQGGSHPVEGGGH